jgi:hypothetical protein
MRVKMGALQYYSKCVDVPTGDWNEGFIFTVSYHAQLFNTVEVNIKVVKILLLVTHPFSLIYMTDHINFGHHQ